MANYDVSRTHMWESLRGDARSMNAEMDNKLMVLESLSMATDDSSILRYRQLVTECNELVRKFEGVVKSMTDIVEQLQSGSEAQSMRKHTQRFEDIIAEAQRSMNRMERENKKRRERSELLHKVHSEINIYNEGNDLRHLTSEQDSLRHTLQRTQQLISEGETARSRLAKQQAMLLGIGEKVTSITEKIPFVGDVIRRIDKKRRRDVVVLALVIAICLLLIFVFW